MTTNELPAITIINAMLDDPNAELASDAYLAIRDAMLDAEGANPAIIRLLDRLTIDERSALALDLSLCPLHMIDYAICFDDDDPECAAIRQCFPSHDT